jgi:integrase
MDTLAAIEVSRDDCIEVVTVEEVMLALERAPTNDEVFQALRELRQDKVKGALAEAVKTAKFDRQQAVEDFLIDGRRGPHTQVAYRLALNNLFAYADMMGIPLLQMGRAEANRFRKWLEARPAKNRGGKLKANSQRLTLAAVSAFWKYLEVTGTVQTNPWAGLALPQREFKHRYRPDGDEPTVPVMNDKEYEEILEELAARGRMKANTAGQKRMKDSARRLIPFVRLLGETGLRLGDGLSMKLEDNGTASFMTKGGKVRVLKLSEKVMSQFKNGPQRPFADWKHDSTGEAVARLCRVLHEEGRIRYAYTAHDFRHRFAMKVYKETRDVLAVQRALGHASLTVTQIYLQGLGVD